MTTKKRTKFMDLSNNNRKPVKGSTSSELEQRVKYHELKGWVKVGKSTVIHGVFRDEHIQVMKYVGEGVDND